MIRFKSPSSVHDAFEIQKELRNRVEFRPLPKPPHTFLGVDVSYRGNLAHAACVLYSDGKILETSGATTEIEFPYVPGLLAFREVPALLAAMKRIERVPDVILVDGHGLAHPRRIGLACHIGIITGLPTIGVAKSHLFGEVIGVPGWIVSKQQVIGAVVQTTKPLFISVGHKILLHECIEVCMSLVRNSHIPEPLRLADNLSKTT